MIETIIIFIFILLGAASGYRSKSLTRSGALAASICGLAVYLGFGINGLYLLGAFFASSTFWSKYKSSSKYIIEEKLAKGATRDWRQVAANGGAAGLFSIIHYFNHDTIWLIGFLVCLASANSDTWASEIGSLSKNDPLYIRTFKRVEKGTSGAISFLGSAASLAGSLLISIIGFWLFDLGLFLTCLVFLFGYLGNVVDTLIGAFYQQVYVCRQCGIETEKKSHCQLPTTRIKGMVFVDNDMVNFISGFIAALLAIVITYLNK
ncbi:DUF92 domain-containing protein [Neobacillus sp. SuZ13]|uniref:DUF92 domain-containing protein n=1 Tax=Neobacillus sp. SuZ13 TaxID=3047875 RepID=UPI0024C06F9A|nr:DUF92 domain-containing protein [Neobacillus sp. SuZ13]WHY65713.1 DUF92 domain-containing protein [Neobacillus sp. SuZ13]